MIAGSAAREIQEMDAKPAIWIASDAIRDLTSDTVRRRFTRTKA